MQFKNILLLLLLSSLPLLGSSQFNALKKKVNKTQKLTDTPTRIKNIENNVSKKSEQIDRWKESPGALSQKSFESFEKNYILKYKEELNKLKIDYPLKLGKINKIEKSYNIMKDKFYQFKSDWTSGNLTSSSASSSESTAAVSSQSVSTKSASTSTAPTKSSGKSYSDEDYKMAKEFMSKIKMLTGSNMETFANSVYVSKPVEGIDKFDSWIISNPRLDWNRLPSLFKNPDIRAIHRGSETKLGDYWDTFNDMVKNQSSYDEYMTNMLNVLYQMKSDDETKVMEASTKVIQHLDWVIEKTGGHERLTGHRKNFEKLGGKITAELGKNHVSALHSKYANKPVVTKTLIPAEKIKESDLVTEIKWGEPIYVTYFLTKPINYSLDPESRDAKRGLKAFDISFKINGSSNGGRFMATPVKGDQSKVKYLQFAVIPNNNFKGFSGYFDLASAHAIGSLQLMEWLKQQAPLTQTLSIMVNGGPSNQVKIDLSNNEEAKYQSIIPTFEEIKKDKETYSGPNHNDRMRAKWDTKLPSY